MSQASTRLTLVIKRVRSARRRQADASVRAPVRDFTTIQDEGFNNGGLNVRFRKLWGDGTIFKGSALTFGGVVYHGDADIAKHVGSSFRHPFASGTSFLYDAT
jgi:hypothetical protein